MLIKTEMIDGVLHYKLELDKNQREAVEYLKRIGHLPKNTALNSAEWNPWDYLYIKVTDEKLAIDLWTRFCSKAI